MRNGNNNTAKMLEGDMFTVLTVPMRNGNFPVALLKTTCHTSSYRTYEEWKLSSNIGEITAGKLCSYRTYEEWKLQKWCREVDTVIQFLPYL